MCIQELQWLLWDAAQGGHPQRRDRISITSDSPESAKPPDVLPLNTQHICVSTDINRILIYSCKLTPSLSANPGLHTKYVHGKTKKVRAALSAEPSVATSLPQSWHSATVQKRDSGCGVGVSPMNSWIAADEKKPHCVFNSEQRNTSNSKKTNDTYVKKMQTHECWWHCVRPPSCQTESEAAKQSPT